MTRVDVLLGAGLLRIADRAGLLGEPSVRRMTGGDVREIENVKERHP